MTTTLPMAICCDGPVAEPMDRDEAEAIALGFKALADPTRVQLLNLVAGALVAGALVAGADRSESCVCDLTDAIGLSQGTISHHLKILVEAGLLARERRGTWAWYGLVPDRLAEIAGVLRIG